MNLMQVQGVLEKLSDDQLAEQLQTPDEAPTYMVLSEVERRNGLRKAYQKMNSLPPGGSIADQKAAELTGGGQGLPAPAAPQGGGQGLPQMAPNMDPRQQAGMGGAAPQGFADGGRVGDPNAPPSWEFIQRYMREGGGMTMADFTAKVRAERENGGVHTSLPGGTGVPPVSPPSGRGMAPLISADDYANRGSRPWADVAAPGIGGAESYTRMPYATPTPTGLPARGDARSVVPGVRDAVPSATTPVNRSDWYNEALRARDAKKKVDYFAGAN